MGDLDPVFRASLIDALANDAYEQLDNSPTASSRFQIQIPFPEYYPLEEIYDALANYQVYALECVDLDEERDESDEGDEEEPGSKDKKEKRLALFAQRLRAQALVIALLRDTLHEDS